MLFSNSMHILYIVPPGKKIKYFVKYILIDLNQT